MLFKVTLCAMPGENWTTEVVKEIESTSWTRAAKTALQAAKEEGLLPKHLHGRMVAVKMEVVS